MIAILELSKKVNGLNLFYVTWEAQNRHTNKLVALNY